MWVRSTRFLRDCFFVSMHVLYSILPFRSTKKYYYKSTTFLGLKSNTLGYIFKPAKSNTLDLTVIFQEPAQVPVQVSK